MTEEKKNSLRGVDFDGLGIDMARNALSKQTSKSKAENGTQCHEGQASKEIVFQRRNSKEIPATCTTEPQPDGDESVPIT